MPDYDMSKFFKNYPDDAINAFDSIVTPELQTSLLNLCSISADFSEAVTKETFDYLCDFSESMSQYFSSPALKEFSKAMNVFNPMFSQQAFIDIANK